MLICSVNELPDVAEQVETGVVAVLTEHGARLFPATAGQELPQP